MFYVQPFVDQTIIDEMGIHLSCNQKCRLQIARALYVIGIIELNEELKLAIELVIKEDHVKETKP